jgi:hypothetical protein
MFEGEVHYYYEMITQLKEESNEDRYEDKIMEN